MKKLISCCLAVVTMLSLTVPAFALTPAVSCSTSYQNSVYYDRLLAVDTSSGSQREIFYQIAQSQLGYHEGSSSKELGGTSKGSKNYTEYGRYMNCYGSWCASFVSWCAAQAGISKSVIKPSVYAGPMCSTTYSADDVLGGAYLPQAGDTVSFLWKGDYSRYTYSHVGIVKSVKLNSNGKSFTLTTIEGNSDNCVKEKTRTVCAGGKMYDGGAEYGKVVNFGVPAFQGQTPPVTNRKPVITVSGSNAPGTLQSGSGFGIRGTISTDCGTLTWVRGEIVDAAGCAVQYGVYEPCSTSHDLRYSINNDLIFNWLAPGSYTYRVLARAENGENVTVTEVVRADFQVVGAAVRRPVLGISGQNAPGTLRRGSSFGIRGTIATDCGKITYVLGEILDTAGNVVQYGAYAPNVASHNLRYSINNDLIFNRLPAGSYTYRVTAVAENSGESISQVLIEQGFTVR